MPQIGEIESGLWVVSGFGGHGLNTTAMAGELIARGIVEADPTWRLFAPYELVWAGGLLGRALAQGIYWGSQPIDRIGQGLARYRERARARKQMRRARHNGRKLSFAAVSNVAPPPQEPAQEAPQELPKELPEMAAQEPPAAPST
jgi:hypothetical protein